MSKKRKSLMDGYFDNINGPIEINPFVSATTLTKKEDIALNASIAPINHDINHEPNHESNIKSGDFKTLNDLNNNSGTIPELKRNNSETDSGTIPELKRNNDFKNKIDNINNISKIDFNSGTIPELKRNNSETCSGTIAEQFRNSTSIQKEQAQENQQFRNNSGTDSGTGSGIKAEQFRNYSNKKVNQEIHFLKLSGNRKKILETIFSLCQKNGSLTTNPLSRDSFERLTGIDGEVIRVTCNRLISEGYLRKKESKRGAGGFLIFEINNIVYSQILENPFRNNSGIKAEQFRNNSGTDRGTDSGTHLSRQTDRGFVSQFENEENSFPKKETKEKLSTLSNSAKRQATWNFADLDFSTVHPINLTIVNVAIQRDAEMTLTQEVVQDFINRFSTYLSFQNAKKIQNSCGLFCSELKKLINPSENGRTQVLDFETEAERKINAEMAQKIIKIQMENELVEKAKELSSDKEKFESEKEVWMQKVRSSSQGINLSEEIIYITAFGNWKEAQQK